MINLSELKRENYKIIWLDGEVLELRKPRQKTLKKMIQIAKYYNSKMIEISQLTDDDVDEVLDELENMLDVIYDLLYDIFSNNTINKPISKDDIEDKFDLDLSMEVLNEFIGFTMKRLGE